VLDDFAGSQAMAAAAYNAGPGRPRRWREGPVIDAAAWAENVPFNETRDYVKKVLSNATIYSHLLGSSTVPPLKARLGSTIGPRDPGARSQTPTCPEGPESMNRIVVLGGTGFRRPRPVPPPGRPLACAACARAHAPRRPCRGAADRCPRSTW
jgi:hypothetical protein